MDTNVSVIVDQRVAACPLRSLARHMRGKRDDTGDLDGVKAGVAPERRLAEGIDGAILGDQVIPMNYPVVRGVKSCSSAGKMPRALKLAPESS
jgi:hypothetical protein